MNFPPPMTNTMDLTLTFNQMKSSEAVKKGMLQHIEQQAAQSSSGDMLAQFGNVLNNEIQKITELETEAKTNVQDFAMGKDIPIHQVVMSIEKSDMAFKMASQVRNHMVRAYKEISQMNV